MYVKEHYQNPTIILAENGMMKSNFKNFHSHYFMRFVLVSNFAFFFVQGWMIQATLPSLLE